MKSSLPPWIGAPLLLTIGVLLVWAFVAALRAERRFLASAIRTTGVVESLHASGSPRSAPYPVVRFTTTDGTTVSATSSSTRAGYRIGQTVRINYDPNDPSTVEISSWSSHWVGPAGLGFFAVLFLYLGVRLLLSMLGFS